MIFFISRQHAFIFGFSFSAISSIYYQHALPLSYTGALLILAYGVCHISFHAAPGMLYHDEYNMLTRQHHYFVASLATYSHDRLTDSHMDVMVADVIHGRQYDSHQAERIMSVFISFSNSFHCAQLPRARIHRSFSRHAGISRYYFIGSHDYFFTFSMQVGLILGIVDQISTAHLLFIKLPHYL